MDNSTTAAPETDEKAPVKPEIVEAHQPPPAPARAQQPAATAPLSLFGDVPPAQVIEKATETAKALTAVLETNRLYKSMGTDRDGTERRHVVVEGWTLLGSMLGVFPTTVWTRQVPDADGNWSPPKTEAGVKTLHSKWCHCGGRGPAKPDCQTYEKEAQLIVEAGKGGWEARVEAHTLGGHLVGAAEAECRWDEPNWQDRDSYALRSMAQTRATSKALRQPLGFIVELAGFRATPAEEMDGVDTGDGGDAYEGPRCPSCGSAVYDNRAENDSREERGLRRRPEYKCRNQACKGGRDGKEGGEPFFTWEADFFEPPPDRTNYAKAQLLQMVKHDRDRWIDRYAGLDAEDGGHPRWQAIASAIVGEDDTQRAGILWLDIMDWIGRPADAGDMTLDDANQVLDYGYTALHYPHLDEIGEDDLEERPQPETDDPWDGPGYG